MDLLKYKTQKYWGQLTKQEKQKFMDYAFDVVGGLYYKANGQYKLAENNIGLVNYIAQSTYECKFLNEE